LTKKFVITTKFLTRADPLRIRVTHDYRRFLNAGNSLGPALAVKAEIAAAPTQDNIKAETRSNFFVDNSAVRLQYRVLKINNIHKQKHAGICDQGELANHA
jgi:hypothetical protein